MNYITNLYGYALFTTRMLLAVSLLFLGEGYAYAAAPTISSVTPNIGTAGTTITITGNDFDIISANNSVTFNSVEAVINTIDSNTIEAVVPVGATTGPITVSTLSGTITSSDVFVVPPASYTAENVEFVEWIGFGQSLTNSITVAEKIGLFLFNGTAGQRMSLKDNSTSYHTLTIYNPDGSTLASTYGTSEQQRRTDKQLHVPA